MGTLRIGALVLCLSIAAAAQEVIYALSDYTSPQLLKIDAVTGTVFASMPVTGHQALFGGLAIDAAGMLYSIDGYNDSNPDRLFRIDPATGAGTVVGPTGLNWNFRTVSVNPVNDVLYAATDNQLFTMNRMTGAASLVASITGPTLDQLTAMVIDCQGNAYITDIGNTGLFSLNLTTGQATHLGDVGGSSWFDDLAFDAAQVLHGARSQGGIYSIDLATAQQTFRFPGLRRGIIFKADSLLLTLRTAGNGVGNLLIGVSGIPTAATYAWILASSTPAPGGPGTGPFYGFILDPTFFAFLGVLPAPYSLLHFPTSANPYATCPFSFPNGTFILPGQVWDVSAVAYDLSLGILGQSNFARLNW